MNVRSIIRKFIAVFVTGAAALALMTNLVSARRRAATLVVAVLAAGLTAMGSAPAAAAADNVINTGDIAVTTFGSLFDGGGGIDKIGPAPNQRTRLASFGFQHATSNLATAPNGDLTVANLDGEIRRVDHVTGAQTVIKRAFHQNGGFAFSDIAVARDGTLVALLSETTGTHLVRIFDDGAVQAISTSSLLFTASQLAIDSDGKILVSSDKLLLRVDPNTGGIAHLAALPGRGTAVIVDQDGQILVHVAISSTNGRLIKVDPGNAALSSVSNGGTLTQFSSGLAIQSDGQLLTVESNADSTESIVRIDPATGTQTLLARVPFTEANDITVAGVSQIGGVIKPVAKDDAFTMNEKDGQFVSGPTGGLLANDRDPPGKSLTYKTLTPPSHGFISAFDDGSFLYFPNSGFHGSDSWTYQAITADGRVSHPATVRATVQENGNPTANNDSFITKYQTNLSIPASGVLKNDTDPQFDVLASKLLTQPTKGIASISSDGSLSYLPPAHFSGVVTFTYEARDAAGNRSAPATVTITVQANTAPTVNVPLTGGRLTAGADGLSGTFPLQIGDAESPNAVTLTATSSNQAIVANNRIVLGVDSTGTRTVAIKATGAKGSATITIKASDTELNGSATINVFTGGSGKDILAGTGNPDLILGMGDADTLNGQGHRDILSGGPGNDQLTGGSAADLFRGGEGTTTITDFNSAEGDVKI